eukprot:TRINITY_DN13767_c0_g1_i1.p1 TRINITY_DN13767_c0_g1~~TRINITY_DN13767_c0_g1_i1.p1  ORF type:complete len:878 (-),score=179.07 TRINITY_DN13767_c0_g1_i1:121-2754(-)
MSVQVEDVLPPLLTITVLSPLAVVCFRFGIPIEIIVFGLLISGYKGPHLIGRYWRGHVKQKDEASSPAAESGDKSSSATSGSATWRPRAATAKNGDADEGSSWRSKAGDAKSRTRSKTEDLSKSSASRSTLLALKQSSAGTQWRGLINKFTPEKFDRLCEQLLATLPGSTAGGASAAGSTPQGDGAAAETLPEVSQEELRQALQDLLSLIFQASSRQHQYTGMYTDLCEKILDHCSTLRSDLDGKGIIWEKCQKIFLSTVLSPPDIPTDLSEDDYADRKVKHKHQMVGMVKFGGDLVSHGLVPCDGVMQWIHTLLSEKHQEVYTSEPILDEEGNVSEKDSEQREVQLEVLCAILASMGSSLSDRNTWSEENRSMIEDVFMQLEQLSMDTERLSLRIRCLIRDILDLRMAQWKEKAGRLKPTVLVKREDSSEASDLRGDAPEFVPGSKGGTGWSSERTLMEGRQWLDPQLLASLEQVEHHLEVIEEKDNKMQRLKALIQLSHVRDKQMIIVANSSNVRRIMELLQESFGEVEARTLDFLAAEAVRKKNLKSFETGETAILVMASEVSTRKDFECTKPNTVLVNYDFPMTLQLFLYRIFKRTDSTSVVYTFFSPVFDIRHTVPLLLAMEGAKQKIPAALTKLKEQIKVEGLKKSDQQAPRTPHRGSKPAADARADDDDHGKAWERGKDMSRTQSEHGRRRDDRRSDWGPRRNEDGGDTAAADGEQRAVEDSLRRRTANKRQEGGSEQPAEDAPSVRHKASSKRTSLDRSGGRQSRTETDGHDRAPWFDNDKNTTGAASQSCRESGETRRNLPTRVPTGPIRIMKRPDAADADAAGAAADTRHSGHAHTSSRGAAASEQASTDRQSQATGQRNRQGAARR